MSNLSTTGSFGFARAQLPEAAGHSPNEALGLRLLSARIGSRRERVSLGRIGKVISTAALAVFLVAGCDGGWQTGSTFLGGKANALFAAVEAEDVNAVRQRIEAGANVNARDKYNRTPLHVAAYNFGPRAADVAQALIEAGADIHARSKSLGTPLKRAARLRNVLVAEVLIEAMIEASADVNARDQFGWTPLHFATLSGHGDLAQALIEAGADVNARSNGGMTPLHIAADRGLASVAQALIEADADVNARLNGGRTPLHEAVKPDRPDAAQALIEALIEAGADVNVQEEYGWTPLHLAVQTDSADVAQALIEAGADVNVTDADGETPCANSRKWYCSELSSTPDEAESTPTGEN